MLKIIEKLLLKLISLQIEKMRNDEEFDSIFWFYFSNIWKSEKFEALISTKKSLEILIKK